MPPRRRRWFVPVVLVALAAVVTGAVIAVTGYRSTGGPAGAVRGYFAALARGDAPDALAFGDIPDGTHKWLTSTVLAEQQRIAPLRDLHVGTAQVTGDRARVPVRYRLAFPGGTDVGAAPGPVDTAITLHRADGVWRLNEVATPVSLTFDRAAQRATVLGGTPPAGRVLLFPGAVPVRLDTDYLALDPSAAGITLGDDPDVAVGVEITPHGRDAMIAATLAALRGCLSSASPGLTCPLPSERYVPGSLHGTVSGLAASPAVGLTTTQVGTLDLSANVRIRASAYRRLDFRNAVSSGSGSLLLDVHALAAAHAPLAITWAQP